VRWQMPALRSGVAVSVVVGVVVAVIGVFVLVAVLVGVPVESEDTWSVKVTRLTPCCTVKLAVPAVIFVVQVGVGEGEGTKVQVIAPTCWPAGMVSCTWTVVPTGRGRGRESKVAGAGNMTQYPPWAAGPAGTKTVTGVALPL